MKKTVLIGAGLILVFSLVAAAQMRPSPAMQMALDNMSKVMVDMPMNERAAYMMKKQQEGIDHGKALYSDSSLGTNARSCNTCHPGGGTNDGEAEIPMALSNGMKPALPIPSLIGAAATFPKYKVPNDAVITLANMNNNCIGMFMMGTPLDLNGQDAKDLAGYVATLSNGREVEIGKMNMMNN